MTPSDELRRAAMTLRNHKVGNEKWEAVHYREGTVVQPVGSGRSILRLHVSGLGGGTPYVEPAVGDHIAVFSPAVRASTADLFEQAAADLDMCESINSRDPDNDGKTRVMPHPLVGLALAMARSINGTRTKVAG